MAIRADKNKLAEQLDGPRALRPEERRSALALINSALRPNGPPTILKETVDIIFHKTGSSGKTCDKNFKRAYKEYLLPPIVGIDLL